MSFLKEQLKAPEVTGEIPEESRKDSVDKKIEKYMQQTEKKIYDILIDVIKTLPFMEEKKKLQMLFDNAVKKVDSEILESQLQN